MQDEDELKQAIQMDNLRNADCNWDFWNPCTVNFFVCSLPRFIQCDHKSKLAHIHPTYKIHTKQDMIIICYLQSLQNEELTV